jgi:hypothetical protein
MPDEPKPATLRAIYRSISVPHLVLLRQAFTLDAAESDSAICRAFCAERIEVIGAVIREKRARTRVRQEKAAERARKRAPAGGPDA